LFNDQRNYSSAIDKFSRFFHVKNSVEMLFAAIILSLFSLTLGGSFRAGTGKVDISADLVTLGCPLAGYNHGARRVPYWPIPVPRRYSYSSSLTRRTSPSIAILTYTRCTTWMEPNTGVLDPLYARSLAISDGVTSILFVTIDAIGSDSTLNNLAYDIAATQGI
jgi:hypothetical protein